VALVGTLAVFWHKFAMWVLLVPDEHEVVPLIPVTPVFHQKQSLFFFIPTAYGPLTTVKLAEPETVLFQARSTHTKFFSYQNRLNSFRTHPAKSDSEP